MLGVDVVKVIKTLKPGAGGELEISDVQNHYIQKGKLKASKLKEKWLDAGTISDLMETNRIVFELKKESQKTV